jgi:DNA-binding GntR family transcriptional regulator
MVAAESQLSALSSHLPAAPLRLTAHTLVCETLRRAILSGSLPGGTRLVQADIASALQVSTTPVREALRDLATEGLITLDPHRGAVVRAINIDELHEIYEIRTLLEPYALRRAAERITNEELARARALNEQMKDLDQDTGAWVELNRNFHQVLIDAAGSPHLASILSGLQNSASMYVSIAMQTHPGGQKQAVKEHSALLTALRKRDPERAAELAVQHLHSTIEMLSE